MCKILSFAFSGLLKTNMTDLCAEGEEKCFYGSFEFYLRNNLSH